MYNVHVLVQMNIRIASILRNCTMYMVHRTRNYECTLYIVQLTVYSLHGSVQDIARIILYYTTVYNVHGLVQNTITRIAPVQCTMYMV